MKLAASQVTLGGAILLLELWALLGPVQCSQGRPSWRYISSEVVIPRKQRHHGKSIPVLGWVSYSLKFSGQRHVIHMQLKKLLRPRNLPVTTQDDQGALQTDYPYVPRDCYYIGYLEDIPYSLVTVDTCYGGIEGIMKLDDLAYEIKPLKDSHRFEHIVSQIVADENAVERRNRLGTKEEIDPVFSAENISTAPRLATRHFASHELNLSGIPQCSNSVYKTIDNFTKCVEYMVSYTSLVDSFLWGLHVRYYIYALYIYNERDPAEMSPYQVPESPFFKFHEENIFNVLHPMSSFVLVKDAPEDYNVSAKHGAACYRDSLIFIGQLNRHYLQLSTITAQQVGRSLGIPYDGDFCICQRRTTCIMQLYPLFTDAFSNCSFHHMRHVDNFGLSCLAEDILTFYNDTLTLVRCGNGKVEAKEQCDCGSFKKCYSDPCCTNNCVLTSGSHCDVGMCCTNCTYSQAGTLCRPMRHICDLPEYCLGNTYTCPADVYVQDGTPCTENSYCYHGNCSDYDMHCKDIFGKEAVKAPDVCYTINTKGFRFGQCTRRADRRYYTPCPVGDMFCGRLQCANVTRLPQLQEHVAFHQTVIKGSVCFGLDEHRRTGSNDVGKVRNGSICAEGWFCDFVFCNGTVKNIKYDCLPEKCSYKGICNNKKNCHCHIGWDPPACQKRGVGGSVNSGPPPRKMRSVAQRIDTVIYLRMFYGRIYALIFAFLIGVATNVRNIKTVKIKETDKEPEGAKE